jgi:hypothetical protein
MAVKVPASPTVRVSDVGLIATDSMEEAGLVTLIVEEVLTNFPLNVAITVTIAAPEVEPAVNVTSAPAVTFREPSVLFRLQEYVIPGGQNPVLHDGVAVRLTFPPEKIVADAGLIEIEVRDGVPVTVKVVVALVLLCPMSTTLTMTL